MEVWSRQHFWKVLTCWLPPLTRGRSESMSELYFIDDEFKTIPKKLHLHDLYRTKVLDSQYDKMDYSWRFPFYIKLGILPLCTELRKDTSCMSIAWYLCHVSRAIWWINNVYRYKLWVLLTPFNYINFDLTLNYPLILTHARRKDQYWRALQCQLESHGKVQLVFTIELSLKLLWYLLQCGFWEGRWCWKSPGEHSCSWPYCRHGSLRYRLPHYFS